MAKANDKASTTDWIWLHDALILAITRLGSVVLAKALLTEWLAVGKLAWSCMAWSPLDEEGITELFDKARDLGMFPRDVPPACREGEPEFWRSDHTTRWEDNIASQNSHLGASASGIKVSREQLLALLPEESRECLEGQTQPADRELAEPKQEPEAWLAWALKKYPQQRNERPATYISRLHGLMQNAPNVTYAWKYETFRVRYYEVVKAEAQAVQKKRNSPRTV